MISCLLHIKLKKYNDILINKTEKTSHMILELINGMDKALNNNSFKIAGTLLGVFAGMQVAAFLSNKINDPQDKVPDRKLTLKDSVANVDDVFGALVLAKIPIAQKLHVEKILPAIFSWCGYRAGNSN